MIKSYADYLKYLEMDKQNGSFKADIKAYLFNDTWKFLRWLRYAEYLKNVKRGLLWQPFRLYAFYKYKKIAKKLGYSIPLNVFGPGLSLPHYGNIVVNRQCRIGANCKVHVGVNIGADFYHSNKAPKLGDNCYIAPGAKIFGGIELGDQTQVGANAVVNKSFPEAGHVLVGMPAKSIKKRTEI